MAPPKPVKKKDAPDKRVEAVLDQAKKISLILRDRQSVPDDQQQQLEKLIKTSFPGPGSSTPPNILSDLDSLGCGIWNAATNIIRDEESHRDAGRHVDGSARATTIFRVFAFMLVDFAYQSRPKRQKNEDRLIRNFKIGLKACQHCLDKAETDLAQGAIQTCAEYVADAAGESPFVQITHKDEDSDNRSTLKRLASEFGLLRMTHAWKTKRLDLAEHFYQALSKSYMSEVPRLAETAAESLYQMGKSMSKEKLEHAGKWLQRAIDALDTCDITQLSQEAFELRLAISASLVDHLVATGSPESLRQAQDLIRELDISHGFGNRLAIHMLQLKTLLAAKEVREEELNSIMCRIIRCAVLTEHTFTTVMKSIHRVRRVSLWIAGHALGNLITERLLPDLTVDSDANHAVTIWIEKACVTYTLFVTSDSPHTQSLSIQWLQSTYDAIAQALNGPLPPRATHATQALIWKAAGVNQSELTDQWHNLLRHALFDSAGQINKAKISRKAMSTAIAKGDIESAREVFFQMVAPAQNESITRYLAFIVALRSNDYQLAIESLNLVTKQADQDPTFLYGCVLETQKSQMRQIAIAALQAIVDTVPQSIHSPSLLRCTAKLLIGELENLERNMDEVMEEILRLFENASLNQQTTQSGNGEQRKLEIDWWVKSSYNVAVKYCGRVHPEHLVRMIRVCTKLMESYPNDGGPMHNDVWKRRSLLCHFLAASALIVLARSHTEDSEEQLQSYVEARREINTFMTMYSYVNREDGDDRHMAMCRLLDMLKFDLECIINLQQWDQLEKGLQSCLNLKAIDRWDALADIALVIQREISAVEIDSNVHVRLTELLQRAINNTWKREKDMVKASRWLRISFSHDIHDGSGDFALKLLPQAADMARKGYGGKTEAFPDMELQWLSITAFNRAVDLLSQGGEACRPWLDGALELARYSADNGALHANLTAKRTLFEERLKDATS